MDNIPFLDLTTATTTDRLCFMILDHLRRAEDEFEKFKKDYNNYEREKKYVQMMECIENFHDHVGEEGYEVVFDYYRIGEDTETNFCAHGEESCQIAMSMIIKTLTSERVRALWKDLFPNHEIEAFMNECYANEHDYVHTEFGYDRFLGCRDTEVAQRFAYYTPDVKKLLDCLTLEELANIIPKITKVKLKRSVEPKPPVVYEDSDEY